MSIKKSSSNSDREIIVELRNLMNLFRTIFSDDKFVCKNIDETYEAILISDLKLIPRAYDKDIMACFKIIKIVVTNIDYAKIYAGINELDPEYRNLGLEVDSYHAAEKWLSRIQIDKLDKLRITNIMTKLRPLFACVDKIFQVPQGFLRNVTMLTDKNTYNDII